MLLLQLLLLLRCGRSQRSPGSLRLLSEHLRRGAGSLGLSGLEALYSLRLQMWQDLLLHSVWHDHAVVDGCRPTGETLGLSRLLDQGLHLLRCETCAGWKTKTGRKLMSWDAVHEGTRRGSRW